MALATPESIVIVGAGHAGGVAAAALRAEGYKGRLVLLGAEEELPYERPPLSKEALKEPNDVAVKPIHERAWYEERSIDLRLEDPAEGLLLEEGRIATRSGERLAFDRCLLATGGRVRRLELPGLEDDELHYLRSLADSRRLAEALQPGRRMLIVGGGFIGLEVAASARARGVDVTLVEAAPRLLARAVPEDHASHLALRHAAEGVDVCLETSIDGVERESAGYEVTLIGGRQFKADLILVGIGILPNSEIAEHAGITCENGILVDARSRSSADCVHATGDVANFLHPKAGGRLRLESWQHAQSHAAYAARAMLGREEGDYEEIPSFWSDQYDLHLEILGFPTEWREPLSRGTPGEPGHLLFDLDEGFLRAVSGFSATRDMKVLKRLMAADKQLDPADLTDPEVKLRSLLKD